MDFEIRSGEIVFIVGGNGSGKSTLLMLVLGLYKATEGRICLNGHTLDESNRESYQQLFSAVLADFHLFEELSYKQDPQLSRRTAEYLKLLQLDHRVEVQSGRYSTVALSSGQRKRLALVSAYLEDRPIYVFDEWAADQDPEFRSLFYRTLLPDLRAAGKAVIAITHDEFYFDTADRVVRMADGRVEVEAALSGSAGRR